MKYFIILISLYNFIFANIFYINNLDEHRLSPYMSYLKVDKSRNIDYNEILYSKDFEKIINPNFGLNFENFVWTQMELKNNSKDIKKIFLLNTIPLTEEIDVYVFEDDKLIQKLTVGAIFKKVEEYSYNRFSFIELSIYPDKQYKILTKVYNPKGRVDVEWIAMSNEAFHHFIFKDSITWGVIFGIFLVLSILLIIFYFILKNKSFISYIIYLLVFWIYLFVNNGFSTLIFGYGQLDLVLSHISGYSIVIFYVLFLDEFLGLSKNKKYPILLKTIYLYSLYLALTSWVIIFSPIIYSFDDIHFLLTLITSFILLFITANESIKTKNIPIFYIFGQLSLIFGYLFLLLYSLQFIPVKTSNQQFLGISIAFEMIFFTTAILSKIKETVELKEKNEKLILSQSHFSTIGQTLKNIAHQWKVPTVRLGTLITELEATLYKKQITNNRIDEIFTNMRNSTEFMKNTITEFSNFYSNDNQKCTFKIIDEINDVKVLLIEKMRFLNFQVLYADNIENIQLFGNQKTFAHICMIIIDNAIDISNQRNIKNPWIRISVKIKKNELIVKFEDNCGGIIQKPINKIFELEISSHKEENRGIGLCIAKMLIEQKMDGELGVKNENSGALFSLIFKGSENN